MLQALVSGGARRGLRAQKGRRAHVDRLGYHLVEAHRVVASRLLTFPADQLAQIHEEDCHQPAPNGLARQMRRAMTSVSSVSAPGRLELPWSLITAVS